MSQFDKPRRGRESKPRISREEFLAMGERWEKLKGKYDERVKELFHDLARQVSPAELAELHAMQQELFELESKLLQMYE